MIPERVRISAGVAAVRLRTRAMLAVQLAGIALVLLGAYNMLLLPMVGVDVWTGYRAWVPGVTLTWSGQGAAIVLLADVAAMVIGAVAAWFL